MLCGMSEDPAEGAAAPPAPEQATAEVDAVTDERPALAENPVSDTPVKPPTKRAPRTTGTSAARTGAAPRSTTTAKSTKAAAGATGNPKPAVGGTASPKPTAGAKAAPKAAPGTKPAPKPRAASGTKPAPKATAATGTKPAPKAAAPKPAVEPVLELTGLTKQYGDFRAADDITLTLDPGTFTGIVGPNGAGKTTTLSMITGLLRPTSGTVKVAGIDVWKRPVEAKRHLGVLPDRLHTFDRLTGGQLLYYTGVLHGLDRATARQRTEELAAAFRVEHATSRLVTDYSSGMLKKIALAAALIHAPRVLVLDEPFESVDPVSAMTVAQILRDFVAGGGTVLLSSHSMELVQRICDHVAVIVEGRLIAGGTVDEVRGDQSLQERFIELAGSDAESIADLTWLHRFSG